MIWYYHDGNQLQAVDMTLHVVMIVGLGSSSVTPRDHTNGQPLVNRPGGGAWSVGVVHGK